MSAYLVQYRLAGTAEWRTYSRHRKIERAQESQARCRRYFLVGGRDNVRIVHEASVRQAQAETT